jgi:nitrite reductase/ring-hydroxylating ferredoxin subunit
MRIETQREIVAEIFDHQAHRTTTMADAVLRIPAAHYTSEEHLAREIDGWFLGQPTVACMTGDVANPGDYFTFTVGGVPVVVVRGRDGAVRAYENVCRHRAAPPARGCGNVARSFSCLFHGWVYDIDDGRLLGQPRSSDGFAEVDPATLGLRPLAVAERHGLVVVDPRRRADGDRAVDVDGWLAGMGDDLGSNRREELVPFRTGIETWQCNWKLLLDTFFESYHVGALHRESLGAAYPGIASPARAFGPHNRIVVPMASILEQQDAPPETWELLPHAVVQYFAAPNVVLQDLYGYFALWRFTPTSVGTTEVTQSLYTRGAAVAEADPAYWNERYELAHWITAAEDYPEAERVHRNLASGLVDHTLIGRHEAGVVLFHTAIAQCLTAHVETANLVGERRP